MIPLMTTFEADEVDVADDLRDCTLCPRLCHADRTSTRLGYCRTGVGFSLGAICRHRGEEPALSGEDGVCNVFFTRCNLQCAYCQNYEISRRTGPIREQNLTLDQVVGRVEEVLSGGVTVLGFVSPSHVILQMRAIVFALRRRGHRPTVVMNTNAYDRVETLRSIEEVVDVYLPDLKYRDADLARRLSDAPDYPEVAAAALREMHRQKGESVVIDSAGVMRSGLIVRHLVLPGQVENSLECLRFLARELGPSVHLSLLAQYHPTPPVRSFPGLGRSLHPEEYDRVVTEAKRLGFENGWIQELGSESDYLPDFSLPDPFGER